MNIRALRQIIYFMTTILMVLPGSLAAQQNPSISGSDVERLRAFIGDVELGELTSSDSTSTGSVVDGVYKVRPGDTLSGIMASQLGDTGVNNDVLQRVIVNNNKSAFRRGNPHWLMAGAQLRMPTVTDVMDYVVPRKTHTEPDTANDWVRYP
jgi:nucleoid-associated protein YgaU